MFVCVHAYVCVCLRVCVCVCVYESRKGSRLYPYLLYTSTCDQGQDLDELRKDPDLLNTLKIGLDHNL